MLVSNSTIYAVGESVFDIIFKNYTPRAAKPGGSAFNAMISLGRLGIPAEFISEVGDDRIGQHILNFLQENGVGTRYVVQFEDGKSALSLAFLNDSSDAEYDFYKDYPAQRLNEEMPEFSSADYLLFGSFYGLNPVLRPQIEGLLDAATRKNALVLYDPNFRSSHLADLNLLKTIIEKNFSSSTIVRASDEDLYNIYGVKNAQDAWQKISHFCDYFVYTANSHGVDLMTKDFNLHVFHNKEAVHPQLFFRQVDFGIGFVVRENVVVTRLIGEGEPARLQRGLFDLVAGAVAFFETAAGAQIADFTAVNCLPLTGFRKLKIRDDARVAVEFNLQAFTQIG